MARAGSEPAIPMFERPKRDHTLDRAATETGIKQLKFHLIKNVMNALEFRVGPHYYKKNYVAMGKPVLHTFRQNL
jgi:hypothetical protein